MVMSDFHTSSFRGKSLGLFSPEQVRALMEVEFERANRYGFPIIALMIGIDRLVELQDLYGYDSREAIQSAIIEATTHATRATDYLGCMVEDKILVVLTHTDREIGQTLARRLIHRARKLEFQSDGRTIRVTLSIGLAHNQHRGARTFEGLLQVAEAAMQTALAAGGDRFAEREEVEEQLRGLEAQLEARSLLLQEEQQSLVRETEVQAQAKQKVLEVRFEDAFAEAVLRNPDLERLREEVLAIAQRQMEEERDRLIADKVREHQFEIDRLERRITKLTESLGLTEEELRRVAKMKNIDLGLSSIFREVQGLSEADIQVERKKEMMKVIFEANLELRDSFKSEASAVED